MPHALHRRMSASHQITSSCSAASSQPPAIPAVLDITPADLANCPKDRLVAPSTESLVQHQLPKAKQAPPNAVRALSDAMPVHSLDQLPGKLPQPEAPPLSVSLQLSHVQRQQQPAQSAALQQQRTPAAALLLATQQAASLHSVPSQQANSPRQAKSPQQGKTVQQPSLLRGCPADALSRPHHVNGLAVTGLTATQTPHLPLSKAPVSDVGAVAPTLPAAPQHSSKPAAAQPSNAASAVPTARASCTASAPAFPGTAPLVISDTILGKQASKQAISKEAISTSQMPSAYADTSRQPASMPPMPSSGSGLPCIKVGGPSLHSASQRPTAATAPTGAAHQHDAAALPVSSRPKQQPAAVGPAGRPPVAGTPAVAASITTSALADGASAPDTKTAPLDADQVLQPLTGEPAHSAGPAEAQYSSHAEMILPAVPVAHAPTEVLPGRVKRQPGQSSLEV